jgi:hypothetical protein
MTGRTNARPQERLLTIPSGHHLLEGILVVPAGARGVVSFAHGSGSGRFSPCNQFVARVLQRAGLATLLIDLLEEGEADDRLLPLLPGPSSVPFNNRDPPPLALARPDSRQGRHCRLACLFFHPRSPAVHLALYLPARQNVAG